MDGRVDAPPLGRPEGRPPGSRAEVALLEGSAIGARADGLPRGPARRTRDRGLHARGLPAVRPSGHSPAPARCSASRSRSCSDTSSTAAARRSTSPGSSALTGVVLVLVGAGLFAFAVHTAHEAGWVEPAARPCASTCGGSSIRDRCSPPLDHRHVRDPTRAHVGRGARLPALRGAHDDLRAAVRTRPPCVVEKPATVEPVTESV